MMSRFLQAAVAHHLKSNGGYVGANLKAGKGKARRHRFDTSILAKNAMEKQSDNAESDDEEAPDTSTIGDVDINAGHPEQENVTAAPEGPAGGQDGQVRLAKKYSVPSMSDFKLMSGARKKKRY